MNTSTGGKPWQQSQQLLTLSFPQKLWLLMNRKYRTTVDNNSNNNSAATTTTTGENAAAHHSVNITNNICKWSRNGTAIRVRIDRLDEFLATAGGRSLFRCRRSGQWLRQLVACGFQRIGDAGQNAGGTISRANLLAMAASVVAGSAADGSTPATPNLDMEVHEYRHESFRRDQPQRIDTIKWPMAPTAAATVEQQQQRIAVRMLCYPRVLRRRRRLAGWPDPCSRIVRSAAPSKRSDGAEPAVASPRLCGARMRLRTVLHMVAVRSMLHAKLEHCARTNDWSMELQADVYENAADSVSTFERRDVAGFYGRNVGSAAVRTFFGEYLPTYAASGPEAEAAGVALSEAQRSSSFEPKPEIGDVVATASAITPTTASDAATAAADTAGGQLPSIAIAQFQIRHDAGEFSVHKLDPMQHRKAGGFNDNLLATISSDYGAQALVNRNHFTPIDYDTSFMDDVAVNNDEGGSESATLAVGDVAATATIAPPVEYELILGYPLDGEQTQQQQQQQIHEYEFVVDDAGGMSFEQFFQMKPIEGGAAVDAVPDAVANCDKRTNDGGDGDGLKNEDDVDPLDAELLAMQQDIDRTLSEVIKTEADDAGQQTSTTTTTTASTSTEDILQEAALIDDDFYSQLRESMDVLYD